MTEYRVVAKTCAGCGTTTVGEAPVFARGRVQYGPGLAARAAWLVCAHHLPARRAASVLATLLGAHVSTGWIASVRGRAARLLETAFLPRVRELIASAPVAHADETIARAAGGTVYPQVACTEYLTAMHVGDRAKEAIDAGGVRPAFDGVLVRDGYNGYTHLDHLLHAWCGAHLLRDLRSIHDGTRPGSCGPRRWPTPCSTRRPPPSGPRRQAERAARPRPGPDPQPLPRRARARPDRERGPPATTTSMRPSMFPQLKPRRCSRF